MLSIFLHEWSHSIVAENFGVKMNELKLYPFGAILYGDLKQLKPREEIIVALAGPAFNIVVATCFVALWWLVPEMYIYTDIAAITNISLAVFNLLPAYPLDGGRVLYGLLSFKTDHRKAFKVVYILGIIISILFMLLYIGSIFISVNYSFMIASIMIMWGAFEGKNEIKFKNAITSKFSHHQLKRGIFERRIVVSEDITLFELIKLINPNYYYIIDVCDKNMKIIKTITHTQVEKFAMEKPLNIFLKEI